MTKEKEPDGNHLTGFLKKLYEMETLVFEQNRILSCVSYHLTNDKPDLKRPADGAFIKKKSAAETLRAVLFLCIPCILIILIMIAATGLFKGVSKGVLKNVDAGLAGSISTYYEITVVLCIAVCIFVCYMKIVQYKDDMEKNRIIFIQNQFQDYKASLQVQYNIGYQNLKQTDKILESLYDGAGIVSKYRGLIPISYIYQYLAAGRCLTLEEACRLFDTESGQGMVYGDIDSIETVPVQGADGRSMLYKAVTEVNHTSEIITADIQLLSERGQIITPDSELSKYYSTISAQLSAEPYEYRQCTGSLVNGN